MTNSSTKRDKLTSLSILASKRHLLDKGVFETLIDETNPDVVFDIVCAFRKTLTETIEKLSNSSTLSNEDIYKVCHKVKGSALLIGFASLAEESKHVMTLSRETPISTPQPVELNKTETLSTMIRSAQDVLACTDVILK